MFLDELKIIAVVVTYNRLSLLKENIIALQSQTFPLNKIIIINNNSTDGTTEYLKNNFSNNKKFCIINLDKNIGGSGGFFEGIKKSVSLDCNWVWLMDDDTIPRPDSLEMLVNKIDIVENVGFLGSQVLFTDGTPHKMNNVSPATNYIRDIQWNAFSKQNVFSVNYISFVSCMINVNAIKKVGLPYRDFFIWGDDQEYTERLIKSGFFGGLVTDSIVYHKTKQNYAVILKDADDSLAWKYFYGERNRVFLQKRNRSKISFIIWFLIDTYKTNKKLKQITNNKKLKKQIKIGRLKGLTFSPKIDFV